MNLNIEAVFNNLFEKIKGEGRMTNMNGIESLKSIMKCITLEENETVKLRMIELVEKFLSTNSLPQSSPQEEQTPQVESVQETPQAKVEEVKETVVEEAPVEEIKEEPKQTKPKKSTKKDVEAVKEPVVEEVKEETPQEVEQETLLEEVVEEEVVEEVVVKEEPKQEKSQPKIEMTKAAIIPTRNGYVAKEIEQKEYVVEDDKAEEVVEEEKPFSPQKSKSSVAIKMMFPYPATELAEEEFVGKELYITKTKNTPAGSLFLTTGEVAFGAGENVPLSNFPKFAKDVLSGDFGSVKTVLKSANNFKSFKRAVVCDVVVEGFESVNPAEYESFQDIANTATEVSQKKLQQLLTRCAEINNEKQTKPQTQKKEVVTETKVEEKPKSEKVMHITFNSFPYYLETFKAKRTKEQWAIMDIIKKGNDFVISAPDGSMFHAGTVVSSQHPATDYICKVQGANITEGTTVIASVYSISEQIGKDLDERVTKVVNETNAILQKGKDTSVETTLVQEMPADFPLSSKVEFKLLPNASQILPKDQSQLKTFPYTLANRNGLFYLTLNGFILSEPVILSEIAARQLKSVKSSFFAMAYTSLDITDKAFVFNMKQLKETTLESIPSIDVTTGQKRPFKVDELPSLTPEVVELLKSQQKKTEQPSKEQRHELPKQELDTKKAAEVLAENNPMNGVTPPDIKPDLGPSPDLKPNNFKPVGTDKLRGYIHQAAKENGIVLEEQPKKNVAPTATMQSQQDVVSQEVEEPTEAMLNAYVFTSLKNIEQIKNVVVKVQNSNNQRVLRIFNEQQQDKPLAKVELLPTSKICSNGSEYIAQIGNVKKPDKMPNGKGNFGVKVDDMMALFMVIKLENIVNIF